MQLSDPAPLVYLASPYNDPNPCVREYRFMMTAAAVAKLVRQNYFVISPVVHFHNVALHFDLPTNFEYWVHYNNNLMTRCGMMFVLKLEGWHTSRGVQHEIKFAEFLHIPTDYLEPDDE